MPELTVIPGKPAKDATPLQVAVWVQHIYHRKENHKQTFWACTHQWCEDAATLLRPLSRSGEALQIHKRQRGRRNGSK